MAHPEWALKHKKKNTELRNLRGKYYLYQITSKRVKGKKWPQKITLGQIGVITEEEGLIPTGMKRKGKVPKNIKFKGLPVDWKCPICGASKKAFKPLMGSSDS